MQVLKIKEIRKKLLVVVSTAVVFLLSVVPLIEAQEISDTARTETKKLFDTVGKFRIQASFLGGGGLEKLKVGETTENEEITISAGGGSGGGLALGYGISSALEVDFEVGVQNSTFSKKVVNAEGSFSRTLLLTTLKYKIPFNTLDN